MEEDEAVPIETESELISKESSSDIAPALISVHPQEKFVVVTVGPELRVFDLQGKCRVSLSDDSDRPSHSDAIRAVCFGGNGRLFASAGDDKLVKIWKTDTWCCVQTVCSEKRVSAVAISQDGQYVAFADKFGVVWIIPIHDSWKSLTPADKEAIPLLGHYCSIITSLEFLPNSRFIASADRDFKIRVTLFPEKPLKGAHEIQSFCLGHTDFVSCLAFLTPADYDHGLLLSGSGDSTVRLWDVVAGRLLDTFEVGTKVGSLRSCMEAKHDKPAVTDICGSPNGSLVAVSIQSFHGIVLLKCKISTRTLSIAKVISMGESYIPTSLGTSLSGDRLWTVMGASNLPNTDTTHPFVRLRVIFGFDNYLSTGQEPVVLDDNEVPGGGELLSELQGPLDIAKDGEALATAAESIKVAMRNLLNKKHYSVEKREFRKRGRNDKKTKR